MILIDADEQPQNGSIAVVSIDRAGLHILGQLYRGESTMILSPDS